MKKIISSLVLSVALVFSVSGIMFGLVLGALTLVNVNPQWETPLPLGQNEFIPRFYWQDGEPGGTLGTYGAEEVKKIIPDFNNNWGVLEIDARFVDILPKVDEGFCNFDETYAISKFPIKEVGRDYKVFSPAKFPYIFSTINKKPGAIYIENPIIVRVESRSTGILDDNQGGTCVGHTLRAVLVK